MSQAQISNDKTPRTERGRRTLRKLLDAAATEFADKGFHEASISGITRRAGVALGTFYTYYDSKDAIFRALVSDMSAGVGRAAREALDPGMGALEVERVALRAFLAFATEHLGQIPRVEELCQVVSDRQRLRPLHPDRIVQRDGGRLEQGREGLADPG